MTTVGGGGAPANNATRVFSRLERIFFVAGLVLFIYLVRRLGAGTVKDNLQLVGWGVLLIVAQELLAYFANSLGWLAAFPRPLPSKLRFSSVVLARIVGDAINYVTPTAGLGGEFIRVRLLRGQASGTAVVASVTVAKLSQVVGQILFIVIGLIVILDDIPLAPAARRGLLIGLSVLSGLVAVLLFGQRRGMFSPIWALASRFGGKGRAPEMGGRLKRLDEEIARFHLDSAPQFLLSSFFFFCGWALGMVEVYLILWLLGVPVTLALALKIEVLSVAFDGVFFFVPAKLGTQEAGKVLIFRTLGLDAAAGLSFGILRHI
ncbi:MAG TPA: lysylphosphatidylglycerol synthase domain-containing protein, partial [Terriglobales bacterium]|nr:lysylphosphatidylglycerol synthase domain-containing protein [Terriglobales bacterium]